MAEWGGVLSYYSVNGDQISKERTIDFIPLKVVHFPGGQYIAVAGSNKQCLLKSNDGIQLTTISSQFTSWVWSIAVHPTSSYIVNIILYY